MVDPNRWQSLGLVEIPVKSVLVIDDDRESVEFVRSVLQPCGADVRVAKDGGQAQSAFVMHKPDFVVLDLILPGESGFEICERMKHTDEAVPVLVLTAINMDDARDLARRVGADGYLCKPVAAEEFVRVVREVAEEVWQRHHMSERSAEAERVRFSCVCGKKFKVSASHKGKTLTCPNCGEPLTVPKRSA